MRVVLDTNVLVSALFFPGLPSKALSAWLEDEFDLVVTAEILGEYRRIASRIGERFPDVGLDPVLDRIVLHALLVVPVKLPSDACSDRDDIKFLECAVAGQAKYVVTGDRALLRASGYEGVEVVTPRVFLEQCLQR
jgi:putative PIN family toxin of toxin-antitoxin system